MNITITYALYELTGLIVLQLATHFIVPGQIPIWLMPVGMVVVNGIRGVSGLADSQPLNFIAAAGYGFVVGYVEYRGLLDKGFIVMSLTACAFVIAHNLALIFLSNTFPKTMAWTVPASHLGFILLHTQIFWEKLGQTQDLAMVMIGIALVPVTLGIINTSYLIRLTYHLAAKVPGKSSGYAFTAQLVYFLALNLGINYWLTRGANPQLSTVSSVLIALGTTIFALLVVIWQKDRANQDN